MSAPLYAVTVLDRSGNAVRLDLVSICDAGCFTASRLFALCLLYEPLAATVYARPGVVWPGRVDGPLRALFTEDELLDWGGSGVPPRDAPRLAIVRDVAYGPFRNVPALATPPDRDGRYRAGLNRATDAAFAVAARAFGAAVQPRYAQLRTHGPAAMPAATLRIEVDDPRWLAHLAPGMLWDAYCFDDEGPIVL